MPPVPPPPQFSPLCSALSAWDGYLTICKVDMNGLFFPICLFLHLDSQKDDQADTQMDRMVERMTQRETFLVQTLHSSSKAIPKLPFKKRKVSPGFSAAVTGEEGGSKRSVRHWRQKNHGVMTITSYSHDLWAQQSKV